MTSQGKAGRAPGLRARSRADGVAWYWIASAASKRAAVAEYPGERTVRLHGTPEEMAARCRVLTAELREWLAGQDERGRAFDGTLASLIDCYQRDEDSPYRAVKWNTRKHYDDTLALLRGSFGARRIDALTGRDFTRWYRVLKEPAEPGGPERVRRAYNCMKLLRIVVRYGAANGLAGCVQVSAMLSMQRFPLPPPRKVAMTFEHAQAIVDKALALDRPSIALAQALQFETALRQRDIIGEWEPDAAPGAQGGIVALGRRWTGGVTWADIDGDLVLTKATTKTGAVGEWDLRRCPLVMAVLDRFLPLAGRVGPLIIEETSGRPYFYRNYTRVWRRIAEAAGVPREVWNMDSRAGGITEGSDAGAETNDLRLLATHSEARTTNRYVRKTRAATNRVLDLRAAKRARGE